MKKNNSVVFTTHKMDEGILTYLSVLKRETEGIMDMLVLYDTSSQPINTGNYPDLKFFLFNSNLLSSFFHQQDRLLPNPLIALIE